MTEREIIDELVRALWTAAISKYDDGFYYCDYCGHECFENWAHAERDPYCPVGKALLAAEKGSVR